MDRPTEIIRSILLSLYPQSCSPNALHLCPFCVCVCGTRSALSGKTLSAQFIAALRWTSVFGRSNLVFVSDSASINSRTPHNYGIGNSLHPINTPEICTGRISVRISSEISIWIECLARFAGVRRHDHLLIQNLASRDPLPVDWWVDCVWCQALLDHSLRIAFAVSIVRINICFSKNFFTPGSAHHRLIFILANVEFTFPRINPVKKAVISMARFPHKICAKPHYPSSFFDPLSGAIRQVNARSFVHFVRRRIFVTIFVLRGLVFDLRVPLFAQTIRTESVVHLVVLLFDYLKVH